MGIVWGATSNLIRECRTSPTRAQGFPAMKAPLPASAFSVLRGLLKGGGNRAEARPAVVAHQRPPLAPSMTGPLHADFVQAHNEALARRLEILTGSGGSCRGLRLPKIQGSSGYGQNQSPVMAALGGGFLPSKGCQETAGVDVKRPLQTAALDASIGREMRLRGLPGKARCRAHSGLPIVSRELCNLDVTRSSKVGGRTR